MLLSLVEGDQPDVPVFSGVVDAVNEVLQYSLVLVVPLQVVHVSGTGTELPLEDRDELHVFI